MYPAKLAHCSPAVDSEEKDQSPKKEGPWFGWKWPRTAQICFIRGATGNISRTGDQYNDAEANRADASRGEPDPAG